MKRIFFIAIVLLGSLATFISASFPVEKPLFDKNGLKIFEVKDSMEYLDASLTLLSPKDGTTLPADKDTFKFQVKGYQLGIQTPDADRKMCANSSKGQHIHFIMDNQPYVASYDTNIVYDMHPGHHVLLAFLSRSYHCSIKRKRAFILKEFNVGDAKDDFDEKAPHLFISRPKGEYVGDKDVKRILLDFYLVNCTLTPNGYKVKATINGTEFIFTKWASYAIEGLPLGSVKIKLELIDYAGISVKSPFNGIEKTILLRNDPMKN